MYAAIDVETGGLDHKVNPMLSVAFVPLDGSDPLYVQIRGDAARCDAKALQINGLDPNAGDEPSVARQKIIDYVASKSIPGLEYLVHPIGQNFGGFDALFLREFLGFELYRKMFSYRYGDTQAVAMALEHAGRIKPKSIKLDHLLEYYGIVNEHPHHALSDAVAGAKLWNALIKEVRCSAS